MRDAARAPESLWFLDTLVSIRVSHAEGEDGISVIENWARHGDSPPLHVHRSEDELFHVLEGEFRFVVAGEERRVGAGETVLTRKGVPHTYRVESTGGGRWLVVTTQGDFERFVREVGRPAERAEVPPSAGPPSPEAVQALGAVAARHGIDLVGPPLGEAAEAVACTHLDQVRDVEPRTPEGCEECLRSGDRWVHLRLCLTCGHVGCCDSSRNKHATKHFHATGHPIIRSFEPNEDWSWCYVDEVGLAPSDIEAARASAGPAR